MQEFMLLIRNEAPHSDRFSPELEQEFLEKCKVYISKLTNEGKLIKAQPLIRQGIMLSGTKDGWKEGLFKEGNEMIVGYYHILAKDLDEAIEIAKGNPEFAYTTTARVEIRPAKMKEQSTGFIYLNAG